jgi:hypothetical protein
VTAAAAALATFFFFCLPTPDSFPGHRKSLTI